MSLRLALFKFPCPIHILGYKNFHEKFIFWSHDCGGDLSYWVNDGVFECHKCGNRFNILESRFNCDKKSVYQVCLDDDEKVELREKLISTAAAVYCSYGNSSDEDFILREFGKSLKKFKI